MLLNGIFTEWYYVVVIQQFIHSLIYISLHLITYSF